MTAAIIAIFDVIFGFIFGIIFGNICPAVFRSFLCNFFLRMSTVSERNTSSINSHHLVFHIYDRLLPRTFGVNRYFQTSQTNANNVMCIFSCRSFEDFTVHCSAQCVLCTVGFPWSKNSPGDATKLPSIRHCFWGIICISPGE